MATIATLKHHRTCTCARCAHIDENTETLAIQLATVIKEMLAPGGSGTAFHELIGQSAVAKDPVASIALACAITALAAKLAALEQRTADGPHLKDFYRGVWNEMIVYGQGQAVTFAGSLWIAKTASVSRRPGAGDGSWQLCVKSGRDGRDGKDCPHCKGERREAAAS